MQETFADFAMKPGRDDDHIRDAYSRASDFQKRWWDHLALNADRPFAFHELANALNVGLHSIPGSMGSYARASKRRYKWRRPYRIYLGGRPSEWRIWMDRQVAAIIKEVAGLTRTHRK